MTTCACGRPKFRTSARCRSCAAQRKVAQERVARIATWQARRAGQTPTGACACGGLTYERRQLCDPCRVGRKTARNLRLLSQGKVAPKRLDLEPQVVEAMLARLDASKRRARWGCW